MYTSFLEQKWNAKRRRIPWHLSYQQWLKLWSRKLTKRGIRKDRYVMARLGDTGPYTVDNVKIVFCQQNNRDANLGRKRTHKNRQNIARGIKAYWANLTLKQRAERGRAVSRGRAAIR